MHRTRVSPLPVSGFFIRGKKVNETTEQTYETPIAPLPWHIERREYVGINNKGFRQKGRKAWFLVDANGKDVRRTYTNMKFILDCVNASEEAEAAEFEAERDEIMQNQLMYP